MPSVERASASVTKRGGPVRRGSVVWPALAAALLAGGAAGCIHGTTRRPAGARCSRDGDCDAGLRCDYGRCRPPCTLDRDCPPDGACVAAEDGSARVCVYPSDVEEGGGCPTGLVLASDGLCREPCPAEGCGEGRRCEDGVCVEDAADGDGDADGDGNGDTDVDGDTDADGDADDDAWPCVDEVCDLLPQCGCPGQKCIYDLTLPGRRCWDYGSLHVGERCHGIDECDQITVCPHSAYAEDDGVCVPWCVEPSDCADLGPGSACVALASGGGGGASVCTIDCDPVTADPCPADLHCLFMPDPVDPDLHSATHCAVPVGERGLGEACGTTLDCARGLQCFTYACTRFCTADGEPCPPGYSCVATSFQAVVGGVEYRVCLD